MSYTNSKNMPRIRREAARLIHRGWSARKVGRYLGFHHTAVMEWHRKAKKIGDHPIPTKSSRPKSHPKQLSKEIVDKIVKKRLEHGRYAEAVHQERPYPLKSGDLVQIDTIHRMIDDKKRLYVFVLIDVFSRWTYARAYERMNGRKSLRFVEEAQRNAPFQFSMLQSDHGPEFSNWFVARIRKNHRYTRIGKPNDNAHVERVNRT